MRYVSIKKKYLLKYAKHFLGKCPVSHETPQTFEGWKPFYLLPYQQGKCLSPISNITHQLGSNSISSPMTHPLTNYQPALDNDVVVPKLSAMSLHNSLITYITPQVVTVGLDKEGTVRNITKKYACGTSS